MPGYHSMHTMSTEDIIKPNYKQNAFVVTMIALLILIGATMVYIVQSCTRANNRVLLHQNIDVI